MVRSLDDRTFQLRFLHKGAAHSEPGLRILYASPRPFEEDSFFSTHVNVRLPKCAMYAIEYTEVLGVSQEKVAESGRRPSGAAS